MSELNRSARRTTMTSQYATTCKVCRFGVYTAQPWVWSRNPLGIVHTACVAVKP